MFVKSYSRLRLLLSWPERRLVGVISCTALKLNKQVMLGMADILGPQSEIPLGVVVQPMKAQALVHQSTSLTLNP